MKKIFIIILIFLFVNGCGFKSVYKNNKLKDLKFNFEIIEQDGDKEINKYILKNLDKYTDKDLEEKLEIKINSSYLKTGTSNDKKGKTNTYNLTIKTNFNLIVGGKTENIVIEENINIGRSSDTFEQKNYEGRIKRDTSQLIINKFINQLILIK